jgi:hypothetical protein
VTPGNEQYQKPEANGAAQHQWSENLRIVPFSEISAGEGYVDVLLPMKVCSPSRRL